MENATAKQNQRANTPGGVEERAEKLSGGERLFLFILYILPKNLLSRFMGGLTRIKAPGFIKRPLFSWFIRTYNVNTEESEHPPESYPSLNAFFTRALKAGVRPIAPGEKTVISPVDSVISQFGDILEGKLIQAKGINYDLEALLACSEFAGDFKDGKYAVMYLSPPDYHRIHTAFGGQILGYSYSPGKLLPVNEIAVKGVPALFPRNERLTTYIQTPYGKMAEVKVGATNVGRIRVTYDDIISNRWIRRARTKIFDTPVNIEKGAELGRFEMGSTVVMVFEKGMMEFLPEITHGMRVSFGQAIGKIQ